MHQRTSQQLSVFVPDRHCCEAIVTFLLYNNTHHPAFAVVDDFLHGILELSQENPIIQNIFSNRACCTVFTIYCFFLISQINFPILLITSYRILQFLNILAEFFFILYRFIYVPDKGFCIISGLTVSWINPS